MVLPQIEFNPFTADISGSKGIIQLVEAVKAGRVSLFSELLYD